MKISHIEIERFRQFQNFQLDLTYPAGHEKAGQALDKVCFIGQSGTGKTTLLELLYLIELKAEKEASPFQLHVSHPIRMKAETEWRAFSIAPRDAGSISFATSPIWMTTEMGPISQLSQSLAQDSWGIMYFPVAGSEKKAENTHRFLSPSNNQDWHFYHLLLGAAEAQEAWGNIKDSIVAYQDELSKFRFRIAKAVEKGDMAESQRVVQELSSWRAENKSTLDDLGERFLDPMLAKFFLEVKKELDSLSEASFLSLIDQQGNSIPSEIWSTGINNLIYKTLPLFVQQPDQHQIILIDEPENSLYPDIQTEIVSHYLRLAPQSQFFFATHSPLVAASFEPWEIVELTFDERGKVRRELHYQGENHVDHYLPDLRYLNYGQVLKNVFDLDQQSGNSDFRQLEQMKLAEMQREIKALNQAGKTAEAEKLYHEYQFIAQKLDWEVPQADGA